MNPFLTSMISANHDKVEGIQPIMKSLLFLYCKIIFWFCKPALLTNNILSFISFYLYNKIIIQYKFYSCIKDIKIYMNIFFVYYTMCLWKRLLVNLKELCLRKSKIFFDGVFLSIHIFTLPQKQWLCVYTEKMTKSKIFLNFSNRFAFDLSIDILYRWPKYV